MGTSFGEINYFAPPGKANTRCKLGKRIATPLVRAGTMVVCGTDSGEIVGLNAAEDA